MAVRAMLDASDDELVAQCKDGNDDAFAALVTRYRARVFGMILRTVGDRTRAEDLAQDVFLRIHRGLAYFQGRAKFSTWAYRVTMNVCLQERQRPQRIEVPVEEPGDEDHAPRELGVTDSAFDRLELRERLEKALAQLPDNYRLLVAAHYLRDVQYEELAEAFGLPLGTVKTQLYRAKKQLREIMQRA
jgi:RNA polymerase sigma-70 factor (ECF subfamily)